MQVVQKVFDATTPFIVDGIADSTKNQLILVFGSATLLADSDSFSRLRTTFPQALIAGCSTSGEIHDINVSDDTLVVTVIHFERTELGFARAYISDASESYGAGQQLAKSLPPDNLAHVLLFSDGLKVNGTELVRGLKNHLPAAVEVTGGLAADGANFKKTLVCANDVPAEGVIAAVGLYGAAIKIAYGSLGGWDSFGPERKITRSSGNILFDLDGKPALELYKEYLGEHAAGLPATALLFPLSLRSGETDNLTENASGGVVRTILGVNEEEQSMTFAGDMPEGCYARLMKANSDRLISGASNAAKICMEQQKNAPASLALLISCVGRKLVLNQRTEEELEAVREILGEQPVMAGFYSYGEISPHMQGNPCELHNQTMTITTFFEA